MSYLVTVLLSILGTLVTLGAMCLLYTVTRCLHDMHAYRRRLRLWRR